MPTKAQYRAAVASEVGDYGQFTTTDQATGPDPARWLISRPSTAAASLREGGRPSSSYEEQWALVTSGSQILQQRRVLHYDANVGAFAADHVFGGTIAASVTFEALGPFPAERTTDRPGVHQFIDWSLRYLLAPDEVTVVAASTADISLAPLSSWLTNPDRLVDVLEPSPVPSERVIRAAYRNWELILDGETPKLRFEVRYPSGVSGNLTLKVLRPARSWIGVSGTYADSTVGLVNESDTALADLDDVVTVSKIWAYRERARLDPEHADGWLHRADDQLAEARKLRYWDATRDDLAPVAAAPTARAA